MTSQEQAAAIAAYLTAKGVTCCAPAHAAGHKKTAAQREAAAAKNATGRCPCGRYCYGGNVECGTCED